MLSVNFLSRYSSNHNTEIWGHLKGVLKYLKGNELQISYPFKEQNKDSTQVSIWSDASFADDSSNRKSTIGNFVYWNHYLISWSSSKTRKVALSTTEAEFIAAAESIKIGLYLRKINDEVSKTQLRMSLFEDNQSCIKWLKNSTGYHSKTKHIEICYHFARELYPEEELIITHVSSENQLADILTKSLPAVTHKAMQDKIRGEC